MLAIDDMFKQAFNSKHKSLFIISLTVAVFSISYFILASAQRDSERTDAILSNQHELGEKISKLSPQNITVINDPRNFTVIVPNRNSSLDMSSGAIPSLEHSLIID